MEFRDLAELLPGALVFGLLTIGLPTLLLYAGGGASNPDNLTKLFLYAPLALTGVIYLFAVNLLEYAGWFDKHPGARGFLLIGLHDPERTFLGKNFNILRSPVFLFAFSGLLATFLGFTASISGQFSAGVPSFVQGSVTPGAQIGLGIEPAVSAETLFFSFFSMAAFSGITYYGLHRTGIVAPFANQIISKTTGFFLATVGFAAYHIFRYGTNDSSIFFIFLQGIMYNGSALITGSQIPAYLFHAANNFFFQLNAVYTSDVSLIAAVITGAVSFLLLIAFLIYYISTGGRRRR